MRKAVLISIKPYWCSLIATGNKTVEARKSIPKLDTPFKCYIYCTKTSKGWFFMHAPDVRRDGKMMGEFICDKIEVGVALFDNHKEACMSKEKLNVYSKGKPLYGWHISDLKIYDKPKELSEFGRYGKPVICPQNRCVKCEHWKYMRVNADEYDYDCDCNGLLDNIVPLNRPPQSWCYVKEREENA